MKKSLLHIPRNKQGELEKILQLIMEVSKNIVSVEMVILYGSYARGDFVEEDMSFYEGHYEEYRSDFDILLVTRNTSEKNTRLLLELEKRLTKDIESSTPVSIIVEDIGHINARLEENRYFYLDIKREGILLFDSGKCQLTSAKSLSKIQGKRLKQEDFELWFGDALNSLKKFDFSFHEGMLKESAFELHQAAERLLTASLLVKTGYKPKTHDLHVLYNKVLKIEKSFDGWFNLGDSQEKDYFELLRKAYVESRYSKHYDISKEELLFLKFKLLWLQRKVEKMCVEEIDKNLQ